MASNLVLKQAGYKFLKNVLKSAKYTKLPCTTQYISSATQQTNTISVHEQWKE